jgi:GNAT superfamily N-acetyltransferase
VLILNGDTPLIKHTLVQFMKMPQPALMVTQLDNPKGQGRIIQIDGAFDRIVEEKDANEDEKLVQLVNCGVYSLTAQDIHKHVPCISNLNAQHEYYLTDICAMLKSTLNLYNVPREQQYELVNVNTQAELVHAQEVYSRQFLNEASLTISELGKDDYYHGYIELLSQLSNTHAITSYDVFKDVFLHIRQNPDHYVFVVKDKNKRCVANVTLLCERKFIRNGAYAAHIEDVVVDDAFRGKGIGVEMIRFVTAVAYKKGCYKVILDCKNQLQTFYSNAGFDTNGVQMSKYF